MTYARSAAVCILGPTAAAALYLLVIAPPQYQSTAAFAIRGAESSAGTRLTGIAALIMSPGNATDAQIVTDFIRSPAMVERLKADYGFDQAYSRFSLDPFSQISPNAPIERATSFWRGRVRIMNDHASGSTTVSVSAFTPEEALRLTQGVLAESETLVNSMADRAVADMTAAGERELEAKRVAFESAQKRLAAFQAQQASLPASASAQQAAGLVAQLDGQLAQKRAELATLRQTFQPDAPQVAALRRQIGALEGERSRALGRALSAPSLNAAAGEVEARTELMEYEFAAKAYTAALETVQLARRQAATDRKYVVSYVPAQRPESSNYWPRLLNIFGVFIVASVLWGVGALSWSVIKDHVK